MRTYNLQDIKRNYNIVGNCDALNRALNIALQVADTDLSVLIEGESGVGKEIIPRLIHDHSPRRRQKYFAVNCGAIPEGTIDSELFGHERGAFTDAVNESKGYFGSADKGTIFLDEVGELPIATQARLLRVLESGEYIRVGGQQVMKTDVRVVAATNVNIRKAISEGRFREDLYYRLNTIPIQMPPLRERGNDILLLFRLFAMQIAEKYHLPRITLNEEAQQRMLSYKWPGNVRQLKNITEQMSVLCEKREIDGEIIRHFIPDDGNTTLPATIAPAGGSHSYENEREAVFKMLLDLGNNVKDLRRELNGLRKLIDDNNAIASQGQTLSAQYSMQLENNHHESPSVEDAVAEEISEAEPESLNMREVEKAKILKALERNNGNRKHAAQALGMSDRSLYRKLRQYGIT
ncbi:MAG: sigma-54-dependent Fis family transcriptional regulator [Prevotella sp.]|nr:sigma-54-dependent Fis family transcriptional regulator [Prevotella sp.]MBO4658641.1 sigma-54-dependent Fis family transcriptional regulator [Prevotella sp.]